jgi:limonene-1,2-epoxide hydrolase
VVVDDDGPRGAVGLAHIRPTVDSRPVNPEDVVRRFCEAWSRRDVDELLDFFTDDAVYHNIPIAPVQGKDGIKAVLQMFVPPAQSISFEILAMVSDGDVVMNERVDRFTIGEKEVALPVAGVFEIRDGKIAAWRDYFDMAAWTSQTS